MGKNSQWETPDIAAMLPRNEAVAGTTTTANVGPYAVPLGVPLRRAPVTPPSDYDYLPDVPEAYRELLGLPTRRKK